MEGTNTEARLWSLRELAEYLGVPRSTIYGWRLRGEGPPGIRVGQQLRYRHVDVELWLRGREDDRSGESAA